MNPTTGVKTCKLIIQYLRPVEQQTFCLLIDNHIVQLNITNRKAICWKCGCDSFSRIKRQPWMRALLTSRLYCCDTCSAKKLVLLPKKTSNE